MKKIFTIIIFASLTASMFAQAPQKMSYQAVIRNSNNTLVTNSPVGMRVSILQGSVTGTVVYQEIYSPNPQTNANGLLTIEIGSGIPITGTFTAINWSAGTYFIKTEADPLGGTNYTITGTSQLLSVPYALYAKIAENGFSGNYTDLSNKPTLFDGTWTSILGKPTFATVATSGNYLDLTNKPVLFSGNYSDLTGKPALWDSTWVSIRNKPTFFNGQYSSLTGIPTLATVATTGSYNDLANLPNLFNGNYYSLSNKPNIIDTVSKYGFSGNYNDLTNKPALWDSSWVSIKGKPSLFNGNYQFLTNTPNIRDTVATYGFSGNYNDLTNQPTIPAVADGSETKLTAGTNITVTGSGTIAKPYVINASSSGSGHYVSELYGGGVIFWVDHTGQHGLIVSMVSLSTSKAWSNITSNAIGTTNEWDGANNTTAIIGQSGHTSSAAKLCKDYTNVDYSTGTYSDWYLPSIAELYYIWKNYYEVQKALTSYGATPLAIINANYWSSSEYDSSTVWYFSFGDMGHKGNTDKFNTFYVRAVRAF